MPRQRTRPEDIKNPEHYFNRFMALEIKREHINRRLIESNEISLEEKLESGGNQLQMVISTKDDMLNDIISSEPDGWMTLFENEQLGLALRRLSSIQREIIRLNFFEGFKLSEIAVHMGKSKSAITQGYSAAMKILKKYFQIT